MSADRRFARIPMRLVQDLERGEISFAQFGLMTYIVAKADRRTRETIVASLVTLKDSTRIRVSDTQLRNELAGLRDRGEIAYQSGQGKRDAYVFSIPHDDYFEKPKDSDLEDTSQDTSANGAANPHENGAGAGAELRTSTAPLAEAETEATALEKDRAHSRDRATPAVHGLELEGLEAQADALARGWDATVAYVVGQLDDRDNGTGRVIDGFRGKGLTPDDLIDALDETAEVREIAESDAAYYVAALNRIVIGREDGDDLEDDVPCGHPGCEGLPQCQWQVPMPRLREVG